jgi:general stress protein YciG
VSEARDAALSDAVRADSYERSTGAPTCSRAGLSPNAHVAGAVPAAPTATQEITMASSNQGNRGGNQDKSSGGDKSGASNRGFASMDPERQREIASQGGKAAHESGNAHEFTSEEAREAGSKGGKAAHEKGTAHEFTSEEAREAGRKGGEASGGGNRGGKA